MQPGGTIVRASALPVQTPTAPVVPLSTHHHVHSLSSLSVVVVVPFDLFSSHSVRSQGTSSVSHSFFPLFRSFSFPSFILPPGLLLEVLWFPTFFPHLLISLPRVSPRWNSYNKTLTFRSAFFHIYIARLFPINFPRYLTPECRRRFPPVVAPLDNEVPLTVWACDGWLVDSCSSRPRLVLHLRIPAGPRSRTPRPGRPCW